MLEVVRSNRASKRLRRASREDVLHAMGAWGFGGAGPGFFWKPAVGGAQPTLSSVVNAINTSVGNTSGGYTVTVTGTNFVVGQTTLNIVGGSSAAVSVSSSTTGTATMPAHASGLVSMTISTTGGGTSPTLSNAFQFWDLSSLTSLSELWMADYSGSAPWTATVGTNLVTVGSDPTSGTTQNGRTPAHFSSSVLSNSSTALGTVWTAGAGSVFCLFKASSTIAESGHIYDDPAFIRDTNADTLMTLTNSGARMAMYDGAYKYATQSFATGAYHLAVGGWDGSNVGIAVDGAAETTSAAGASTVMTGTILVGSGYAGGYIAGDMLALGTCTNKISAADRLKIRAYCVTRFNVSV